MDKPMPENMSDILGKVKQERRRSSRIPRFYRLSVEQRLAFLQRSFNLSNEDIAMLRGGKALRIDHAVNMVENAIGVLGVPLGLGLNFLVDQREYLIPMAIEEASIIAAASKAGLAIRGCGGFTTKVSGSVMIGQIQVLEVADFLAAKNALETQKQRVIDAANLPNARMVERGGGVYDIVIREVECGEDVSPMLVVHLLTDVQEAMGANAVNYACEAAGPVIEEITGGRVNLRIVSNLATERLAEASFRMPLSSLVTDGLLASGGLSGAEVAQRLVEASDFAANDPWRAATHNKGIFNGICAAALALGQDWRAIEAGGHAYASESGKYRGLTRYYIDGEDLVGEIKLPLQVGWVGGAVNAHPGVKLLRKISGIQNAKELAGVLAALGLGQNFAACMALCTVGIQSGHMALHARSVAISVGVPGADIEEVAQEMIRRGDVKTATAEKIFAKLLRSRQQTSSIKDIPVNTFAPGKVVLFGEHSTVYGHPGITAAINIGLRVNVSHDIDGPRFLLPKFKQLFNLDEPEIDMQLFSQATDVALEMFGLRDAPIAVQIESALVPGMGLGSSAAFSAALCRALRIYANKETQQSWDNDLFEEVQRLESIFHGQPSGMDAATVLSGGVLWFRVGPPQEMLPLRMPEPLTGAVCIVEPGARTIDMVRQVQQSRELNPTRIDAIMNEIGEITARAGSALGRDDHQETGALMLQNHELLGRLGVSTEGLDRAVEFIMGQGALGAKLTGSGGGGAVIAIAHPEQQLNLVDKLVGKFPLTVPFTLGAVS